jgi:hypothetical protein
MPIAEITIGLMYKNEITCETNLFINISEWLIIKGSISIITVCILSISILLNKQSLCNCITGIIAYIFNIFVLSWLITGSILFWRDCNNLTPDIVNNFMWVSLIIGYISLINNINFVNRYQPNSKNKKPLLDASICIA